MPHNLDTGLLRAFLAVAETGGMTAAARQLHLTQAAVSQQIRRLEESFEKRLFERDRRGLRLTPAGERLRARAQKLLMLHDEIWAAMTAPDHEGEVRLGVPHDIVAAFMPPILKRFDQVWPKVRVTLVCSTTPRLLDKLEAGEVDLALTTERQPGPGGEALRSDRLVWVGARDGEAHRRNPLPIALGDERCAFRPAIMAALAEAGRDWRSVCDIGSQLAIEASVRADLAVTGMLASSVVRDFAIIKETEAGALPPLPMFSINLYLPRAGATDIARELARHIEAAFAAGDRRAA